MRTRISIILVIAICISMTAFSASASTEPTVNAKITEALNVIECVKGQFGIHPDSLQGFSDWMGDQGKC